ncbi:MAG: hypothetical protein N2038_13035 [Geminicoccaceae bacterium]|nr:hypothetical protein [Geminicoccaceae bacterium]MCX7631158.1 hypothetical protein [Geminicoccaceae bacterium]
MKAFLAAVAVSVLLAFGAHWVLTTRLDWSSASRFAAPESVRLDPGATARRGL